MRYLLFMALLLGGISLYSVAYAESTATSTAKPAISFINSIGVETHLNLGGAYNNIPKIAESMEFIGTKYTRTRMPYTSNLKKYVDLANYGVKFTTTSVGNNIANILGPQETLMKTVPGSVDAVEGWNEIDISAFRLSTFTFNGLTGVPAITAAQKELYRSVRANPVFAKVPVFDLTGGGVAARKLELNTTLVGFADYANIHHYPSKGAQPLAKTPYGGDWFSYTTNINFRIPGPFPKVVTEFGYNTRPIAKNGWPVDEKTQAKGIMNGLLDSYNKDFARLYVYELFDEGVPTDQNFYHSYGLFYNNFQPKMAAVALHNLTTILNSKKSNSNLGDFNYVLDKAPATLQKALLKKADGHFVLLLWNEIPFWDAVAAQAIVNQPVNIDLSSDDPIDVEIYDPLEGKKSIKTYQRIKTISVAVSDYPVIIEMGKSEAVNPEVLLANQVIVQGQNLADAVKKIQNKNFSEKQISFENSTVKIYANKLCGSDACKVFAPAGGNAPFFKLPQGATSAADKAWSFTATTNISQLGTGSSELLALATDITDEVCKEINSQLGISTPSSIPLDGAIQGTRFIGVYPAAGTQNFGDDLRLKGKPAGCAKVKKANGNAIGVLDNVNIYYQVLLTR